MGDAVGLCPVHTAELDPLLGYPDEKTAAARRECWTSGPLENA